MVIDQKNFDESEQRQNIDCVCDYCGNNFQREKRNIIRGWSVIKKDACTQCNSQKRKDSYSEKYRNDPVRLKELKEKRKKTCIEKYGVGAITQAKCMQEKSKQTCLERYGVENASQSQEIRQKMRQTCLERYGVKSASKSPEIQQKIRQTCLERYGVEHPFLSPEIQNKRKNTFLKKYGVENPSQASVVKDKRKQTNLERYGVEYYYQSKEMKEKSIQTCIERYGTPQPNVCYGKTQKEIQELLNSFGFNFKSDYNILEGKEIDLLDLDLKLGIEYCGLYWHNELSPHTRNKNYHYEKFVQAKEKGIRLITIFEDEWLERREQCENFLLSILNQYNKRIYARKCLLQEIDKQVFSKFCEENHIQGKSQLHTISFGLYFDNELVGVIGLSKHHRQTNKNLIVLNRLCFKKMVKIIGGSSRLFSKCIEWCKDNAINEIISWSDNRWSQGKVYEVLGFQKDGELKPDYSYVDLKKSQSRLSKQSCKKSNIGCPKEMTEREFLMNKGIGRIWDCGKIRWKIEI